VSSEHDIDWLGLFAALRLNCEQRSLMEVKRYTSAADAGDRLRWRPRRLKRVKKQIERILSRKPLHGRREEFEHRSPIHYNSRHPFRWERLSSGHRTFTLDFLPPEFAEIMRSECPQVSQLKQRSRDLFRGFVAKTPLIVRESCVEHKDLAFELKRVDETGTFTGLLSAYGVVDLGNDCVQPGAFRKTLLESNGTIPMLFNHDASKQLGVLKLSDTNSGLHARGLFNLGSALARDVHSNLIFNLEHGVKTGLSIGYRSIKDSVKNGVRYLQELRLFEGSITLFPMLPQAQITSAKTEIDEGAVIAWLREARRELRR
jgi:HK97 family phage prohead protease